MQRNLNRVRWDLTRFGFTPNKLISRLTRDSEPKILCISIPKSGTHLLERALCLHPRLYRKLIRTINTRNINDYGGFDTLMEALKPGQILVSHLWYTPDYIKMMQKHNVRCFFMIRNPRDIVVSMAFYMMKQKKHALHEQYAAEHKIENRIRLAISGTQDRVGISIGQKLERYAGWLDSNAMVVRFEDIIGARGGGTEARQTAIIRSIFDHLGMEMVEDEINRYSRSLFSAESPTFRKGMIDQWKDYFDDEIEELYRQETCDWLPIYSY